MDNNQALGYMLLACQKAGLNKSQAKELFLNMNTMLDIKTETEAEKQGHDWYYSLEQEDDWDLEI